ncbi:MAG: ABC transporter permease [Acidobacteriia bacterium]|nr:ABC transporter permease [Terriglobia bacterium]
MNLLFSNPEIVRNARIQLRPGRMIAAAVICAVASAVTWASIMHADVTITLDGLSGAGAVFALILNVQVAVLLIGGGIYCLQSVHREKELNTFDYQRVTRLKAVELAFGKLFGAPVATYFVVLCLMPVALVGAIRGHVPARLVAEAYIVLLLGSIAYHSLALLISIVESRGGGAMGIVLFLAVVGYTYSGFQSTGSWRIHGVTPFVAGDLVGNGPNGYLIDLFFGVRVSHVIVLFMMYAVFIAWFLLAATRNLKRDPSVYEVYSPPQAFGFALYVILLMVGFFPWKTAFYEGPFSFMGPGAMGMVTMVHHAPPPQQIEQKLLGAATVPLAILALILLRSRERVRRRVLELADGASGWWAALWPMPYLVAGVAVAGAAIAGLVGHYRNPGSGWDWQLALYDVAFLAVWLARDALYLQWMNVRRSRRPLASASLYLIVFYGSSGVIFSALNLYNNARSAASTAILVPSPLFALSQQFWNQQKALWVLALALQGVAAVVFVCLHWVRLHEFSVRVPTGAISDEKLPQHA